MNEYTVTDVSDVYISDDPKPSLADSQSEYDWAPELYLNGSVAEGEVSLGLDYDSCEVCVSMKDGIVFKTLLHCHSTIENLISKLTCEDMVSI